MHPQQFATFNPQQQQQQQFYARTGSMSAGAQQFTTAPFAAAGPAAALAAWTPPTAQELQYLDALFAMADEERRGAIGGQQAVAFFSRSKLDKLVLREVWSIADSQKRSELSRNDFFVAMRLIAMAQRGEPVSLQRFLETAAVPHPLPVLEGVPQPQMQPQMVQAMQAPVGMGPPMSATQHAAPGLPGAPTPAPSSGGYAVTDEEKSRYDVIFKQYDADGDGFLLGSEAVALFQMSGLDRNALRDIWTMADKGQDSKLDLQEFYAAMHLIVCVSKRNLPLPSALPQELHDSVFGPSPAISTGYGAPTPVPQQASASAPSGDPMDAFAELSAPVNDAPLPSLSPPEPARTASFHPEPITQAVGGAEPAHYAALAPENVPSRRNSGTNVDGSRYESNSGWPAVQPPPAAPTSAPASRERTGSASSMSSMSSFTGIAPPVRAMGSNDRLNAMGGHPPLPHPLSAGGGGMMAGGYGMASQVHPTAPSMPQAGYGLPGGAALHVVAPPKPFMSEDEEQSAVRELAQQNELLADSIAKVESKQKTLEALAEKLRGLDQLRHELVALVMKREKLRAAMATSAAAAQPEEDPAEAQTRAAVERSLRQLVDQEKQQAARLQADVSRLEAKLQAGVSVSSGSLSSAAAASFGAFAAASSGQSAPASTSFGDFATSSTTPDPFGF